MAVKRCSRRTLTNVFHDKNMHNFFLWIVAFSSTNVKNAFSTFKYHECLYCYIANDVHLELFVYTSSGASCVTEQRKKILFIFKVVCIKILLSRSHRLCIYWIYNVIVSKEAVQGRNKISVLQPTLTWYEVNRIFIILHP